MTAPNFVVTTRTLRYGPAAIAEAAALIAAGEPVAVPTETVYGLAADATNTAAVARIYAAKGRPSFNPLIVHVPDLAAAERIGMFDADARALAQAFWPGPLTLVVPLRPDAGIAALVTAGLTTIALRVPRHRAMQALLKATGKPLAAPSANASNRISPTRAAHVLATLDGRIPLIVDDGPTAAGLESTIVKNGAILRPGPIAEIDLRHCHHPGEEKPPVTQDSDAGQRPSPGSAVEAPGQLPTHYAPAKPVRLNAIDAAADEWLIGFGTIAGDDTLSASGDPIEAAARLFDALYRADASPRPRIAVAPVPTAGIGAAINDRLRRAAHR
ncbi:L-threonylcarbamoyladenylate synthase [Hephaestia sp. GCM10023244]|uniref:L-threonylcarbamoyladenylate synthase n=1 Tax=unclassified Hephaestia TaxID=2631281 RepID=UPI002077944F|nr:L-threonylcarbamoyladenylate synthase [Hephaestia sp. MAHUQ-44]MCM8731226.1 L-threonylcarbamoyladenylate synthase [Hephaestia sp. MAHUQ-44]